MLATTRPGVAQVAELVVDAVGIAREERGDARPIVHRRATATEPRDEAANRGADPATEREVVRLDVSDEAVAERKDRVAIHAGAKTGADIEPELLELAHVLLLPNPLLHAACGR